MFGRLNRLVRLGLGNTHGTVVVVVEMGEECLDAIKNASKKFLVCEAELTDWAHKRNI